MNPFDDVRQAVSEAKSQIAAVDVISTDMAKLLVGRLRHVNAEHALVELKRELRKFNIHTKKWERK